jgi:hypothetical protein
MSQIVSAGTSNDVDTLTPYGISEAHIVMAALDGIAYAHDKAQGNRQRFAHELAGEFAVGLYEAMGLDLPDD